MKRLLYLAMAALMVVAMSCKKETSRTPVNAQWVLTPSPEGGIFTLGGGKSYTPLDLSLKGGKGVWLGWSCSKDIRSDVTYLYSNADTFDYTVEQDGDEWVLSVHWGQYDMVQRIKNLTSTSGVIYEQNDASWMYDMKKQSYKLAKTDNIVKLTWTYQSTHTESTWLLTNDMGLKSMTSLSSISSSFKPLIINGEGAAADYQGKEATMKFVVLKQNKGLMSISEKRRIAADRGALAVIICPEEDAVGTVFTKENMDSLPTDEGIPVFYLGQSYWTDKYLDEASSFSITKL